MRLKIWSFILALQLPLILVIGFVLFQSLKEASAQGISPFLKVFLSAQTGGLEQPVHITNAGDGSGRLFVVEQPGRIRIIKNGSLQAPPFLDISGQVSCCGERGLLSIAFPPVFRDKGYFYVNYTDLNGSTVVERYHVTANPDIANPDSGEVLLTVTEPFANHNGGQVSFAPDGFLYIGMGDGGGGGDPQDNAQNPSTLLGKLLRIDVESPVTPPSTYVIPTDNPFVGNPGFRGEIWAIGLRNPWRFSFDRLTGDLYIGDVGQTLFEEINFQHVSSPGGENYGWNIMEGLSCFNELDFGTPLPSCNQAGLILPVAEYDHTQGCSVTGGMVYRGQNFSLMQGIYFYGDFCTGRIWGLKRNGAVWQNQLFLDTLLNITTFGEDEAGELYLSDYLNGRIYRLIGFSSQDITNLVTKYYLNILDREPDQGGWDFWISEINRIVGLDIDIKEGFIAVGKAFFNSDEYLLMAKTDAAYVTDLYETFLNRTPSQAEIDYWVGYLTTGMSRNIALNYFVYSPEFKLYMEGLFGAGMTRPENNLINDFYRGFLNRLPDSAGFNGYLGLMRAAQCTGAQAVKDLSHEIALGFIQSAEYGLRGRTDSQFVEDLYDGILRRGALPSEVNYWLGYLNAGTLTRAEVLQYFTNSPEFQIRVQQVIDAGCL